MGILWFSYSGTDSNGNYLQDNRQCAGETLAMHGNPAIVSAVNFGLIFALCTDVLMSQYLSDCGHFYGHLIASLIIRILHMSAYCISTVMIMMTLLRYRKPPVVVAVDESR